MRLMIWLILVCFVYLYAQKPDINTHFNQANQYYQKKDFKNAKIQYEKALEFGITNSDLYYNYANALFRLNQKSRALQYYYKALKLKPNDIETKQNIEYVKSTLSSQVSSKDNLVINKSYFFTSWSPSKGMWIAAIGWVIGFGLLIIQIYLKRTPQFVYAIIVASGIFCVGLIGVSSWNYYQFQGQSFGIVLMNNVIVYSGPSSEYKAIETVNEGTQFIVLEEFQNWVRVKNFNQRSGFILKKYIGVI